MNEFANLLEVPSIQIEEIFPLINSVNCADFENLKSILIFHNNSIEIPHISHELNSSIFHAKYSFGGSWFLHGLILIFANLVNCGKFVEQFIFETKELSNKVFLMKFIIFKSSKKELKLSIFQNLLRHSKN